MNLRDTRRKFGQNYLSDPAIIFEMGQSISAKQGNNFLEIGPGMGALTNTLNLEGINIARTFSFPKALQAIARVTAESIPPDNPSIAFFRLDFLK